ncbi:MAG: hypothetical protein GXZ14_00825 [Ruminococcaceae bacterium]|nr:hypothetical protein [Oscillospiraceae bacterium]
MSLFNLPHMLYGEEIETDFRLWLRFGAVLTSPYLLPNEKEYICNRIIFKKTFTAQESADRFMAAAQFFSMGQRCISESESTQRLLDWREDLPMIWADMKLYAGIDIKTAVMHWHEFYVLFLALPPESRTMQAVGLRALNLDEIKDAKQRGIYERKKRAVALEGSEFE